MSNRSWVWLPLVSVGCPKPEEPACGEFEEVFVWQDTDEDGYGGEKPIGYTCAPVAGEASNDADCDDTDDAVHPNAEEVCDLVDNDCNARVDETTPKVPWYHDTDGDGYGSAEDVQSACQAPDASWIGASGDCDDVAVDVNPGQIEVCNGIDDDCDGLADDQDGGVDPSTYTTFYVDADGDGYGDDARYVEMCQGPAGSIAVGGDCDDDEDRISPGEVEECDGIDNDCDELVDDEDDSIDPSTQEEFFTDADGDGFGDASSTTLACEQIPGAVLNDDDCDDADPLANVTQNWYLDTDGDGSGTGAPIVNQCLNPGAGTAPESGGLDCAPTDPDIFPLQVEVCDDVLDQDCDALVDCSDTDCYSDTTCVLPCADRVVDTALPYVANGNTAGQGDDFDPLTCGSSNAADVTFQFVPAVSAVYVIDTQGSTYDTMLYVREGCTATELGCNDDSIFGLQSRVQVFLTAGVQYLIVVDGYSSNVGNYTLNIQ